MAPMPGTYQPFDDGEIDLPVTEDEAYSPSAEGKIQGSIVYTCVVLTYANTLV